MPSVQKTYMLPLLTTMITLMTLWGEMPRLLGQQMHAPLVKVAEQDYTNDPTWKLARQEVDRSPADIQAQHQAEQAHGVRYNKLIHGSRRKKWIALTFDDGPHPTFTPKLLALLREQHVKATFFVVGEMAARYPDLVREELAEGHSVGNHTYHHVNLTKILPRDVATEVQACGDVLQRITGQRPHLFRPPGGDYDKSVIETLQSLGYTTVLWTDDPGDYASPGSSLIVKRTFSRISSGGIILIHDGIEQTFAVLPQIISTLKKEGYTFVTVDEMLKDQLVTQAKTTANPLVKHNLTRWKN